MITDLDAAAAYRVWKECGSIREAADALGIPKSTVWDRVKKAKERGLTKGGVRDVVEQLRGAFADFRETPYSDLLLPPSTSGKGLLTVYPIADLHVGMYSWGEEAGHDYDLSVAKTILELTSQELIGMSPPSNNAVILNLGDFFHADNDEARTRKSAAVLDTDTRYAKVLRTGVDMLLGVIHLALQRHQQVCVVCLPGNHDPYSSTALTVALEAYYHSNPRVVVDTSPSPFFFLKFGKVMLAAHHGDTVRPEKFISVMAAKQAKMWGSTEYRYAYLGHIHGKYKGGGEQQGATWEVFQTLAPKDAWNNSMGFTSGRSMQSITLDEEKGEIVRLTVAVRGAE